MIDDSTKRRLRNIFRDAGELSVGELQSNPTMLNNSILFTANVSHDFQKTFVNPEGSIAKIKAEIKESHPSFMSKVSEVFKNFETNLYNQRAFFISEVLGPYKALRASLAVVPIPTLAAGKTDWVLFWVENLSRIEGEMPKQSFAHKALKKYGSACAFTALSNLPDEIFDQFFGEGAKQGNVPLRKHFNNIWAERTQDAGKLGEFEELSRVIPLVKDEVAAIRLAAQEICGNAPSRDDQTRALLNKKPEDISEWTTW